MFQQAAGNTGHPRITRHAPVIDPLADFIHLLQFNEAPCLVAGIKNFIAGPATLRHNRQTAVALRIAPMLFWPEVRRIDDQ